MVKKINSFLSLSSSLIILSVLVIGLVTFVSQCQRKQNIKTEASPITPWVGSNRNSLRYSRWFIDHKYTDCPDTAANYWPKAQIDCLIPEGAKADGIYYKHFTPQDVRLIYQTPPAEVSFDSLIAGLDQQTLKSVTIMVHPIFEKPITNKIGTRQRVINLYQGFVEGAVGKNVSVDSVHNLYLVALNNCEQVPNVQESFKIDEFQVAVEYWPEHKDCNITVRKSS